MNTAQVPDGQLQFDSIYVVTIHESDIGKACEPTISIHPDDTDKIVAGSVLNNVYKSTDAGKTWTIDKLVSKYGVYGDPVIRHTMDGGVLYAHLSNPSGKAYSSQEFLDRIVVQKSTDDGLTWSEGSFPLANKNKDHDKHWLAVDPTSGVILMSWTEFDKYGSKDKECHSRILFSVSSDHGVSWSDAISISETEGDCLDDDNTTEGAFPAIGIDGTYYVVWGYNNRLFFDKSKDKGRTWLINDKIVADQPGGWAINIPGIGRCNGMPVIKCDHSQSKNRGNLYISWADQRSGEGDTDIWLISSADQGKSWKKPVRVNNDAPGRHQFFAAMDVDQTTGYIYFVFYDRRHHADNHTDVYIAYSTDGGKTFENKKISEKPFLHEPYVFFGDYNDISAHNGRIRPIWTRQDKSKLSVQTAIIDVKKSGKR